MESEYLQLLNLVGGKENIVSITHCVTRLRFVLKDESKADIKKIEELPSVKGTFTNAGQFQIIIGNKVKAYYKEFIKVADIQGTTKEEVKKEAKKKMPLMQKIVANLAEIFVPIIPAIIVGGLILGFRNIIGDMALFGEKGNQTLVSIYPVLAEIHSFLWIIGEAIFHFLPVAITWSTVKKFGGSEILGIVLGITLVSPQLMNAYAYATATKIPVWNFGLFSLEKVGYQAQVIPAILSGLFMVKMESFLNKKVPDILKLIVVPFMVLTLTVLLSYGIIGPISREIGNLLAFVFTYLLTGPFKVLGAIIFGLSYAPLVITGLHHTFIAVDLQLISQGGTMIWPMVAISNIAQGSAAVAIMYLSKKNAKLKSVAASSGISAWLGVTEPAMFGVNLKLKYPFYAAIIGSAIGATYSILTGVLSNSIGIGGLPAFLAVKPQYWVNYIIACLIAVVVPMILTYIFYKKFNREEI